MDKQTEDGAFEIAVDFAPAPDPRPATPTDQDAVASEAAETPATVPEAAARPGKRASMQGLRDSLPLLLAGLAIFAALVATIGLIVVSRNVAETNQRIAALQAALKHAPAATASAPIHATPVLLAPMAGPTDKPASIEEVRALLFALRKDLVNYQNMGGNAGWVKAIRDAQAELANRLNTIAEKVDRIDRRVNGNRPASPADDRARPS